MVNGDLQITLANILGFDPQLGLELAVLGF
jgi:hypothetical protein